MKKIVLKKLTLDKYRGQNAEVVFSDKVTKIYARNAVGKSTLFNAYLQLLTRADYRDMTNADMFDTKKDQTYEDNDIVVISADFEIDGLEYEIKQTAQFEWQRNKESGEYERGAGIKYTFEIDGIPRNATAYSKWIEENIAPIDKIKIMANIYHFNQNISKWEDKRKQLALISGEITDKDFGSEYDDLLLQLKRYSLSELKQRVKTMSKPLKEQLGTAEKKGTLLVQIESMEANLPDVSEAVLANDNIEEIKAYIAQLDKETSNRLESIEPLRLKREKEQEAIQSLKSEARTKANKFADEQILEKDAKRKQLNEVMIALESARVNYMAGSSSKVVELKMQLKKIENENNRIIESNDEKDKKIEKLKSSIGSIESDIKKFSTAVDELRAKRAKIKEQVYTPGVCSECGAELKGEALNNAEALFNKQREANLAEVVERGKAGVKKIEESKAILEKEKSLLEDLETRPTINVKDTSDLKTKIKEEESNTEPFDDCAEYLGFKKTIELLKEDINEPLLEYNTTKECADYVARIRLAEVSLTEVPVTNVSDIAEKKKSALNEIERLSKISGLKEEHDRLVLKIKELKISQKEISAELAIWDKLDEDIKSYEKEYARLVQNKANALFSRVTVEMLKENKSGKMEDTCKVYYKGIPFEMWNNAEKSLSGIDISLAFMKHYSVLLPIFIDNTESINDDALYDVEPQMIQLYVSNSDYKLRVE